MLAILKCYVMRSASLSLLKTTVRAGMFTIIAFFLVLGKMLLQGQESEPSKVIHDLLYAVIPFNCSVILKKLILFIYLFKNAFIILI